MTSSQAKPYKLLLHVGLPKTATTSLRNNVLIPLHEQGRINFIGRSNDGIKAYDRLNNLTPLRYKVPHDEESYALPPEWESTVLDAERLNVISNESIIGDVDFSLGIGLYTITPLPFADVAQNLADAFQNCDVTVMLTLRAPETYVFSYFVEWWHWILHSHPRLNTFDKFLNELYTVGNERKWEAFHHGALVSSLMDWFPKTRIMLYEDIVGDPDSYFAVLSELLCGAASAEEVGRMMTGSKQNVTSVRKNYAKSEPIALNALVASRYGWALELWKRYNIKALIGRNALLLRLYDRFRSATLATRHPMPDEATLSSIRRHFAGEYEKLIQAGWVPEEKLERYRYL